MTDSEQTPPPPPEEPRPSPETLALLYDEIARDLDSQQAYVEHLNQRAQQLFGFSTVILAIVAGVVPSNPCIWTKLAYGLAFPFFLVSAFFSGQAWDFRKWRMDPDVVEFWDSYRFKDEEHLRHQVIQNRLDGLAANKLELRPKLKQVKRAQFWLYLGFAYLVVLLLYRVISA